MKKRFLAFILTCLCPAVRADLPSCHNAWTDEAAEGRFRELFAEPFLASFERNDAPPLMSLPLTDRIKVLVVHHGRTLTEEQLIFLLELSIRTDNSKFLEHLYHETNKVWGVEFDKVILKAGSNRLKMLFFYDILLPHDYYLRRGDVDPLFEDPMEWKNAVGFYDPFQRNDQHPPGPLFSTYNQNYSSKLWLNQYPNVEGLLPSIADYVTQEYQRGYTVFFHGQHTIWIFLESIYRRLYAITHNKKFPDDFIALRFRNDGLLSHEEVEEFKKLLRPYRQDQHKEKLLFVNLHPDAGYGGQNSLYYAAYNADQKNKQGLEIDYPAFIKQIFSEFGLDKTHDALTTQYPHVFDQLFKSFKAAVEEQGNHGRLLVISMPRSLAQTFSYCADLDGDRTSRFYGTKLERTSDPVTIADHYHQMSRHNQFVLLLVEEFINPEAAAAAGVKIVGFDPACYWRTEKWLGFEQKLDSLVKLIEKIK